MAVCTNTDFSCINCNNFDWWNDNYIKNHNGVSLQATDSILWQNLVDTVINSGQTFYANSSDGELPPIDCCRYELEGFYKNGVCFCTGIGNEIYLNKCLSNIDDVLNLIFTPSGELKSDGYRFFLMYFRNIGSALGLTSEQLDFIMSEDDDNTPILGSSLDTNNNGISDKTEARLILTNALSATGGFYVSFGQLSGKPIPTTQNTCNFGYWDSVNKTCMCKPIVNQCKIDLSQVSTLSTKDFYNNIINVVVYKNTTNLIGESCCNRLIKDNPSLPWVWQEQPKPACYTAPKEDCLPAKFSMNDEVMGVPPCNNNLEISMWVYFKTPEKPCGYIPVPPNDTTINLEGQFCDITLTPNTGVIVPNSNPSVPSTPPTSPTPVTVTTKCCYNNNNPILARVNLNNTYLNQFLTHTKIYNSSLDYFDDWVQIKAILPTSGLTSNFKVNLEIYQGLSCCCDYDIYVDDIRVDCPVEGPSTLVNDVKCPGFTLNRVIDNKKSWVYNPGNPSVGTSEFDVIEREDGNFGMLNGEGSVNRTFAPSLDADLPWRYTNYYEQSGVYENHSNLVINSKELWLTYDMCTNCPVSGVTLTCPEGYILSANTKICYSGNT